MICSFCGKEIEAGRGIIFALKDGTRYYFCSSKCDRNFRLKRKPRKMKWVVKTKKAKKKE